MEKFVDMTRGSGRTARQLAALPDGSIFVVPNMKMAGYCQGLLRWIGRAPTAIQFVTPQNYHRFEGASAPAIDVDHAYWDVTGASVRAREAVDFVRICVIPGR